MAKTQPGNGGANKENIGKRNKACGINGGGISAAMKAAKSMASKMANETIWRK